MIAAYPMEHTLDGLLRGQGSAVCPGKRPKVVGFTGGLGGRDVAVSQFIDMVNRGEKTDKQAADEIQIIGVRE